MITMSLLWMCISFVIAGIVTWIAGVHITKATDSLDTRFKLGDALGGLILLGISGSLPEIAITLSAARAGHISVIIGNLLGGIAIQSLLLVVFDFVVSKKRPLSYLTGSPLLSLETLFAIIVTAIALAATFIPARYTLFKTNPLSIVIVFIWVAGLFFINKARKISRLYKTKVDAKPGRKRHERQAVENHPFYAKKPTWQIILIFVAASLAILVAGFVLEETGTSIASHLGINAGIFAATIIALIAALPEISTGLAAIFMGDNHLAVSDIMGGNAFMLTFFFVADVVIARPVLSYAGHADVLLGILGIVMMGVYAISFLFKPKRCYLRLGIDSILQIIFYAFGLFALTFIR